MPHRRYEALFIDFYGTVVGGDRAAVEATCSRIVDDLELPMSGAEFAVVWGREFFAEADRRNHGAFGNLYEIERDSLSATLEQMGSGGADPGPYIDQLKAYWAAPTIHPESVEALDGLDVPVCCLSNADTEDILAAIERHRLRFDYVLTSEDARCYKPDESIFRQALDLVGVVPERVVHAGDSLHADVGGAAAVGITTVWVCRDGRIFDVGSAAPDHNIPSLLGLRGILGNGRPNTC